MNTAHHLDTDHLDGPPLLAVEHVDFSYGPLQVLFDVSLAVAPGAQIALLGTNGAGKSTLLKVAAGLVAPSRGRVWFRGNDVTALPAEERVKHGLVHMAGGRATFPTLTVHDNLRLGAYLYWRDRRRVAERLGEVLEVFPHLRSRLGQPAGTLSGGEQQMLALGRVLVTQPSCVLLDELSLGLAPVVLQEIVKMLEEIVRRGTTVVLVEQSLNIALELTDTAYFMEKGEIRFSGPTRELLERGDLVRSVFFDAGGRSGRDEPEQATAGPAGGTA